MTHSYHLALLLLAIECGEISIQAQPSGISQRLPNSSFNFPQTPSWPGGYQLVNAFGTNTFVEPVCISTPPGESNRVFVLDRIGIIEVLSTVNAATPTRSIYMDLQPAIAKQGEQGLLGLAFHPNFQSNGLFFVYRSVAHPDGSITERLSRFSAVPPTAPAASAGTEVILFDQVDQSLTHNGGDLHFGNDGYLYISVGDGGAGIKGINDQTIRKGLHSGILRLDVDNRPENILPNPPSSISGLLISTNYLIPNDNPYFTTAFPNEKYPSVPTNSIRTEFWAVGLRNPWRFSIDPVTDWILVGDVGDGTWEEIDLIVKGGNYGWAITEGATGRPGLIDPIYQYAHGVSPTAIIGGLVYRGTNLPALSGAYIFAEFGHGEILELRFNGSVVTEVHNLLWNGAPLKEIGIAAFGTDPANGDVLVADLDNNVVRRLIYTATPTNELLPGTLAGAGVFANVADRTPYPGIVAYSVNVPSWWDFGFATYWFSVPNTNLAIGWDQNKKWTFPSGTFWIQHFRLRTNTTLPSIPVETRVLLQTSVGVYGVSYRWGGRTNDAMLVGENGANDLFIVTDGAGNELRRVNWFYPARNDCLRCHNSISGPALGLNTAQLNGTRFYPFFEFPGSTGTSANQLYSLAAVGYFSDSIPDHTKLPALALWNDTSATLERRVRSYLSANCAECHQPGITDSGRWDARYHVSTPETGLIWGFLENNFGNTNAHAITPRSLTNSMVYQRLGGFIGGRMPFGSTLQDTNNMNLLAQWIGTLSDLQPPFLRIALGSPPGDLSFAWPLDPDLFDLYSSTNLAKPIAWIRDTNSPVLFDGQRIVTVPAADRTRFYRLQSR